MIRAYATVTAFEAALKHNLMQRRGAKRTYADLRKQVAFDRLLARLNAVAPDVWLLKGGVALEYRLDHARATKDVDLSAKVDFERITQTLADAARVGLDDYFLLRIAGRTKPADSVETYRYGVEVLLENGKLFDRLNVDVASLRQRFESSQFVNILPKRYTPIPSNMAHTVLRVSKIWSTWFS